MWVARLQTKSIYGEIRHFRKAAWKPITVEDAKSAATARAYSEGAVAARNNKDFVDCGVTLVDPWVAH